MQIGLFSLTRKVEGSGNFPQILDLVGISDVNQEDRVSFKSFLHSEKVHGRRRRRKQFVEIKRR